MNRDGRFIIEELQKRTQEARDKAKSIKAEEEIAKKAAESERIKKEAKRIFEESMTEEKLFAVADRGFDDYPLLFISSDRKTVDKYKKTGKGLSQLAIFLSEELIAHNFEPQIVYVCKKEQFFEAHHMLGVSGIEEPGFYLGIRWEKARKPAN